MIAIAVLIDRGTPETGPPRGKTVPRWLGGSFRRVLSTWAIRGYREANAGHLVSIVAFNALVALVPTLLLVAAVAGIFLRDDRVLAATIDGILVVLPAAEARDALEAVVSVRRYTGWIGALSLVGFLWIGTNFADAIAHCLNRVYRVPDCGYICTRRKAFGLVVGAAGLFLVAAIAGATTVFAALESGLRSADQLAGFGPWLGYVVAFLVAAGLFLVLYRVLPNAGQHLPDVWPGALVAATLFVLLGQVFPLYLWLVGGVNRYGVAFGLASLLVTWFAALGHVLLFGAYVNATLMRRAARRDSGSAAQESGSRTG